MSVKREVWLRERSYPCLGFLSVLLLLLLNFNPICASSSSPCSIQPIADVNRTLIPNDNITLSAMIQRNCCCGNEYSSCYVVLYPDLNPTSSNDNCSSFSGNTWWNALFVIPIKNIPGDKVVVHIEIHPNVMSSDSVRGYLSNNITIRLQGTLGIVANISTTTTCKGALITWVPPTTLEGVPITKYVTTVDGEDYNTVNTSRLLTSQEVKANTRYLASITAWNEVGPGKVTSFWLNTSAEPSIELSDMDPLVFFLNSTHVNVTLSASSTDGNCTFSLPQYLLAVFSASGNYTHSVNESIEEQFDESGSLHMNFTLPLNKSYSVNLTWSNFAGHSTNKKNFDASLFKSVTIYALENGSIFYSFEFLVINVNMSQFYLDITSTENGEVIPIILNIDPIVEVISNVTEPMCKGNYTANYSIQLQDTIISNVYNRTIVVNEGLPCSLSTPVVSPTSGPITTPTSSGIHVLLIVVGCVVAIAVLLLLIAFIFSIVYYKQRCKRGEQVPSSPQSENVARYNAARGEVSLPPDRPVDYTQVRSAIETKELSDNVDDTSTPPEVPGKPSNLTSEKTEFPEPSNKSHEDKDHALNPWEQEAEDSKNFRQDSQIVGLTGSGNQAVEGTTNTYTDDHSERDELL